MDNSIAYGLARQSFSYDIGIMYLNDSSEKETYYLVSPHFSDLPKEEYEKAYYKALSFVRLINGCLLLEGDSLLVPDHYLTIFDASYKTMHKENELHGRSLLEYAQLVDPYEKIQIKDLESTSYLANCLTLVKTDDKVRRVIGLLYLYHRDNLYQAVKWKKISANPVKDADPPSVKYEKMNIWSQDEIQQFLTNCKGERHYLTFLIAIYSGMRRGEILGLKWSDIDFHSQTIQVNRSLASIPKEGYIFTTPKTKSSIRRINVPEFVIDELKHHKKQQEDWKELVGEMYEDLGLIICTNNGTFQDPRNVVRVMKRVIKSLGITDIRFHDIRHTHASFLIAAGIDIVRISNRLGHASPRTTLEFYAHLLKSKDNDIADTFHNAVQNNEGNTADKLRTNHTIEGENN